MHSSFIPFAAIVDTILIQKNVCCGKGYRKFAGPLAQGRVGSSVRTACVSVPIAMTIRYLPGGVWPRTLSPQSVSGHP